MDVKSFVENGGDWESLTNRQKMDLFTPRLKPNGNNYPNVARKGIRDLSGVTFRLDKKTQYRDPAYSVWRSMVDRVYNQNHPSHHHYEDVEVSKEWLRFSNYRQDYLDGYVEGYDLDKDIVSPGARLYSRETCRFIPHELNTLFGSGRLAGDLPQGVMRHNKKFIAQLSTSDGLKFTKVQPTIREALDLYFEMARDYKLGRAEAITAELDDGDELMRGCITTFYRNMAEAYAHCEMIERGLA